MVPLIFGPPGGRLARLSLVATRRETLEIDNPKADGLPPKYRSRSALSQGGCSMAPHLVSRSDFLLLLFVFLCFLQPFLSALGQNAQIAGTVSDSSKAVIPNASIEIVETATQVKWDTISNGDGRYVASSLGPGGYQITVLGSTFETQVVSNLRLNVASKVSLDFVLHPGAVSQSVTVDVSGIHLNTTDASVSTVIDRGLE